MDDNCCAVRRGGPTSGDSCQCNCTRGGELSTGGIGTGGAFGHVIISVPHLVLDEKVLLLLLHMDLDDHDDIMVVEVFVVNVILILIMVNYIHMLEQLHYFHLFIYF